MRPEGRKTCRSPAESYFRAGQVHTAYDEDGEILEVSESVWASDRIIILDEYEIDQDPAHLQGLSDI
jgi:hypothetical protein